MIDPIDTDGTQDKIIKATRLLKIFVWVIVLIAVSSMLFRAYNNPANLYAPIWIIWLLAAVTLLAPFLIFTPESDGKRVRFWSAMYTSAFAIVLSWVVFGPGERIFLSNSGLYFSFGPVGTSSATSEVNGRMFFGIFAISLILASAWLWKKWLYYDKKIS